MVKEKSKEHICLSQKIKTLEGHQEVLRQHIKDQEKLISIEEGRSTTRNFVNKATQSETGSFIKDHVETSYLLRQLKGSFNTKLTEFSANILGSVSEVIDKKIGEMENKLAIMP